jgi:hypothetical protein
MKKFDQLTRLLDGKVKNLIAKVDRNTRIRHINDELRDFVVPSDIDKRAINELKMK